MKYTLPTSPIWLAVVLFCIDLALAVILTIVGRILDVDLSTSLLAAIRSYAAAVMLGAWYTHGNGEMIGKDQASTLAVVYCAASFVILSAVFMMRGASDPLAALVTVFGTLIILTVQFFLLSFLVRKSSELMMERVREQQRLPGL